VIAAASACPPLPPAEHQEHRVGRSERREGLCDCGCQRLIVADGNQATPSPVLKYLGSTSESVGGHDLQPTCQGLQDHIGASLR